MLLLDAKIIIYITEFAQDFEILLLYQVFIKVSSSIGLINSVTLEIHVLVLKLIKVILNVLAECIVKHLTHCLITIW